MTVLITALLCYPNPYSRMPQPNLIKTLFKTCKYDLWGEDLCHYNLTANWTSLPAYEVNINLIIRSF